MAATIRSVSNSYQNVNHGRQSICQPSNQLNRFLLTSFSFRFIPFFFCTQIIHDHISYRYEILEVIGKGSFGQVVRALDYKTNKPVAIKIIRNKKRFHHQALVEVRILDELRKKDPNNEHNVIHMQDYFYFRNHLCISFELMR